MATTQPDPVPSVANDILEATMLSSCLAGSDTTLAKLAKRTLRFKTSGSLEEGDLAFDYSFPDGAHAEYKLIHGVFSTRTGFQAAAFDKNVTDPEGKTHSSVKLIFPGTAMRSQFADLNAFDTFWMKRIGSQIHNAKAWLETEVLPRLSEKNLSEKPSPAKKPIEISAHCLGTQNALWAKAFLEQEHHKTISGVALIEPTAPGLVVDDITTDIKDMYGISAPAAIRELYRGVYSVFVDPPTIVSPFGYGNMWDTVAVGDRFFAIHLPETKLYDELAKAVRHPRGFRNELNDKIAGEKEARQKEKAKQPDAGKNASGEKEPSGKETDAESGLRAKAFFKTALGKELGEQFFKNHYLLSLSNQIINGKKPLAKVISENPVPDARAMLAHRPPRLASDPQQRLRQLVTAHTVNTGRDIANMVTQFCLKGGRMGVPRIADPHYIWNTPQILTMDDTLEENYPPHYFRNASAASLRRLLDSTHAVIALAADGSRQQQRLQQVLYPITSELQAAPVSSMLPKLPDGILSGLVTEMQARAIVRHLPNLRGALREAGEGSHSLAAASRIALAALDETEKNLRRAFGIKPEHDMARYR